jgi:4-amino-4-deoxy-L-arabinose transferase-like glycosyltransferase
MKPQRQFAMLVLILVGAFAIRVGVMVKRSPMLFGGDEGEYVALARGLASSGEFRSTDFIQDIFQGGRPGDPTAYRSPVLPAFLAVHYMTFGDSQWIPRLVLVAISSLTCLLLALLGCGQGRCGAGLLAACAWAVWPPAVIGPYAADRFYPETLAVFFLVGHSVALVWSEHRKTDLPAAIGGLGLGLAVLTRGYLALLIPATVLSLAASRRRRVALVVAAFSIGVPASWVARNAIVMGVPVLSTQTDHFYLGNNRWARGSFNGDFFLLGRQSPQLQQVAEWYPGFWQMSELQRSRAWSGAAVRAALDDPARIGWLLCRKALVFMSPLQFWSVPGYPFHLAWIPAASLAAVALWDARSWRKMLQLWPLILPIGAVFAAVLATYAFDRYRFVIEPYVVLLAAYGLSRMNRRNEST